MKKFLIFTQILYVIFLPFWFLIWGISFMGFDSGFSWLAVFIVIGIGLYPVAAVVCSVLAWVLRNRNTRPAVIINLIPMIWVLGLGIPVLIINIIP